MTLYPTSSNPSKFISGKKQIGKKPTVIYFLKKYLCTKLHQSRKMIRQGQEWTPSIKTAAQKRTRCQRSHEQLEPLRQKDSSPIHIISDVSMLEKL